MPTNTEELEAKISGVIAVQLAQQSLEQFAALRAVIDALEKQPSFDATKFSKDIGEALDSFPVQYPAAKTFLTTLL